MSDLNALQLIASGAVQPRGVAATVLTDWTPIPALAGAAPLLPEQLLYEQVHSLVIGTVLKGYRLGQFSIDRVCLIVWRATAVLPDRARSDMLGYFFSEISSLPLKRVSDRRPAACLRQLAVEIAVELANKRDGVPLDPDRDRNAYQRAAECLRNFGVDFSERQIKAWHYDEKPKSKRKSPV